MPINLSPSLTVNIPWNVYIQECRFKSAATERVESGQKYRSTCEKLLQKYPDSTDLEMFMRAQFLFKLWDREYSLKTIVYNFKHFNSVECDKVYEIYKANHEQKAIDLVDLAYDTREMILNGGYFPWELQSLSPLGLYVTHREKSTEHIQAQVAVDCLHWPVLKEKILITPFIQARLDRYKRELLSPNVTG